MTTVKRYWGWRLSGALLLASVMGALGWGWRLHLGINQAEQVWREKLQEQVAWRRLTPAPTEENQRSLDRELAAVAAELAACRKRWRVGTGEDRGDGTLVADTYFELAAAITDWRTRASQARVELRAGECFGFAAYAQAGPAADLAPFVRGQRKRLRPLLAALLEAQPLQLLAVQRQNPRARLGLGLRGEESEVADDFFEWKEPMPRSRPAEVTSEAFRFEFSGTTQTLRLFLNALAVMQPAVLVRDLAVVPVGLTESSHFSVVVECPWIEVARLGVRAP